MNIDSKNKFKIVLKLWTSVKLSGTSHRDVPHTTECHIVFIVPLGLFWTLLLFPRGYITYLLYEEPLFFLFFIIHRKIPRNNSINKIYHTILYTDYDKSRLK